MNFQMIVGVVCFQVIAGGGCAHSKKETRDVSIVARDPVRVVVVNSHDDDRGWLGVQIQNMTPRLAKSMGVKTEKGALVNEVMKKSPAEEAGIKDKDVIVEFDGKKVDDAEDLVQAVRNAKPDSKVTIAVMRNDKRTSLTATIGKPTHRDRAFSLPPTPPRPPLKSSRANLLGMKVNDLNEQLGEYFEAPNGKGVLVEHVKKESPAEKAGIKAGDVITGVGKKTIETARDLRRSLRDYDRGEKVDVHVIRKGAKRTYSLEVAEYGSHSYEYYHDWGPRSYFHHDFEWIEPDWKGLENLEDEIRIELERIKPDLEKIKKRIERKSAEIRERIEELKARFKPEVRVVGI